MSTVKKIAVVALVVALSHCVAPAANAGNPFEKFFQKQAGKVVGGVTNKVTKNVAGGSKLLLKAAPYALLHGANSGSRRSTSSNNSFGTTAKGMASQVMQGKSSSSWKGNYRPTFNRPTYKKQTYSTPNNYRRMFRR